MGKPAKLTPLQERFCRQYLIDLNGAAAYRRAGYAVKNGNVAKVEAFRLLTNPNLAARIAAMKQEQAKRLEIQADDVLRELAAIAFADPGDAYDFSGQDIVLKAAKDIPEPARRAIKSIKVKDGVTEIAYWDKPQAIDKLGKHLKLWDGEDAGKPPAPARTEDERRRGIDGILERFLEGRKQGEAGPGLDDPPSSSDGGGDPPP